MNTTLLIDPLVLDPADFPPLPLTPGFAQLVNDELGNAALPTDGFDTVFDELVAIVDGLDQALGVLAGELVSAFGEADTIDAAPVGDTVAGFAGALGVSSTAVDNLGTLLTGAAPPTPTGGGGGGGGGGAAAGPIVLDFGIITPRQGVVQLPIEYDNGTQQAVTIKSITFAPAPVVAAVNAWVFPTLALPATVQPGGSFKFTVGLDTTTLGGSYANMTVDADGTPPKGAYFLKATVTGPPPTGGGGRGGQPPRKL